MTVDTEKQRERESHETPLSGTQLTYIVALLYKILNITFMSSQFMCHVGSLSSTKSLTLTVCSRFRWPPFMQGHIPPLLECLPSEPPGPLGIQTLCGYLTVHALSMIYLGICMFYKDSLISVTRIRCPSIKL